MRLVKLFTFAFWGLFFVVSGVYAGQLVKDDTGFDYLLGSGLVRLEVHSDNTIRVIHSPATKIPELKSFAVISPADRTVKWSLSQTAEAVILATNSVYARLDKADGSVSFSDHAGNKLLSEASAGTEITPAHQAGYIVGQSFKADPKEALYGLGQQPDRPFLNNAGTSVTLQQQNGKVSVPVLLSSRGYMLLWDNPAVTQVDLGVIAGVNSWQSQAGKAVDYYFMYGPTPDQAVAQYRRLTGVVPMFPHWTWGFWQCKERYASQEEILGILAQYRQRQIPIDGIIQDWQYWRPGQWGSHEFDPVRFPDPAALVRTVHDSNAHIIISVWPRFDVDTNNCKELEAAGALYPELYDNVYPAGKGRWYDAFNPAGRQLYGRMLNERLAKYGFDGWWADGCEAELGGKWGQMNDLQTAAGPGAQVYNAYPLLHTAAIAEGHKSYMPGKRVFILARSAYAGQQRNGVVTWSGDIKGKWEVLASQIPAGLNFCATGMPYWNTDIGGFFGGEPSNPGYGELFTRWFQFGTFCPMFRVHGTGAGKELWRFGQSTTDILVKYNHLRYRLLPYIYSVAWQVTSNNYTMMRPLVMDFYQEEKVLNIADQFMFGPALMVNPVVTPNTAKRKVYLPDKVGWYDFWTGQYYDGGREIEADCPIDTMPLFVRAGSIVPMGPVVQFAREQISEPIELRIYPGADGSFTLYNDEGDNYNYEKGLYSIIPLQWHDKARTLTLGKRQGDYPGMPATSQFRIIIAGAGKACGLEPVAQPDKEIIYDGSELTIAF
ncbi:MAG: glycoside hydrolase family 31 protein [Sedimentisphaerales bacterium]|nr:glycoside hydrolase family 31 protein [Sedimentisphaerales bacterium]